MSKKKNTKPSNSVIFGIGAAGVTTVILTTLSYQIFKTEPISKYISTSVNCS